MFDPLDPVPTRTDDLPKRRRDRWRVLAALILAAVVVCAGLAWHAMIGD